MSDNIPQPNQVDEILTNFAIEAVKAKETIKSNAAVGMTQFYKAHSDAKTALLEAIKGAKPEERVLDESEGIYSPEHHAATVGYNLSSFEYEQNLIELFEEKS